MIQVEFDRNAGILTVTPAAPLNKQDFINLAAEVDRVDVYARVTPEHKLRLVSALQANAQNDTFAGPSVAEACTRRTP